MTGAGPLPKAESPALFSRTAPKGVFGAHPAHSYGDPPGPSPAQLFQDSRLLYLTQDRPVSGRTRAPRPPETGGPGGSSLAGDPAESYEKEGLEGHRETLPSKAEKSGNRHPHHHHLSLWGTPSRLPMHPYTHSTPELLISPEALIALGTTQAVGCCGDGVTILISG